MSTSMSGIGLHIAWHPTPTVRQIWMPFTLIHAAINSLS